MSEVHYGPAPTAQFPAPEPVKPVKKKRKWILPVAMLVGGLVIGSASAGSAASKAEPVATPTPQPTITKTVTQEVKVPTTPAVCLTALDRAGELNDLSSRFAGAMGDVIKGVQAMSTAQITAANAKVDAVNAEMKTVGPQFVSARAECRGTAK